jgi:hypothetical protein
VVTDCKFLLESISKLAFCFFRHSGLDPESSDFAILLYKNKQLRISNLETLTSLDAGFHRHDLILR